MASLRWLIWKGQSWILKINNFINMNIRYPRVCSDVGEKSMLLTTKNFNKCWLTKTLTFFSPTAPPARSWMLVNVSKYMLFQVPSIKHHVSSTCFSSTLEQPFLKSFFMLWFHDMLFILELFIDQCRILLWLVILLPHLGFQVCLEPDLERPALKCEWPHNRSQENMSHTMFHRRSKSSL